MGKSLRSSPASWLTKMELNARQRATLDKLAGEYADELDNLGVAYPTSKVRSETSLVGNGAT